jgi:hypothetical protein
LHNDMALLRKLKKCSIFELTSMQVQKKKHYCEPKSMD